MEAITSALVLTFHGLKGNILTPHIASDHATQRYLVSGQLFKEIVEQCSPRTTCTVSEFAKKTQGDWTVLTFDDGFMSDFEVAFPILTSKGLRATLFVTAENIGRPGYTNVDNLKEMVQAGMEIASHGFTHRYLVTMPRAEAVREICESKEKLEREIGVNITSFAPVGGHFQRWMLEVARDIGYRTFATMIPGRTCSSKGILLLRRNHIQAHHDAVYVSRLLNRDAQMLILNSLKYHLLRVPKSILGMRHYDRTKGFLIKTFLSN